MKRCKEKRIICLLLIFNFMIFSNLSEHINFGSLNTLKDTDALGLRISGFWNLTGSPIYIDDSNPAYNWAVTVAAYDWCSGYGNSTHPYIIEDIVIGLGSSGTCVEIENSAAYFRVENCSLYDADHGIELSNVSNGQISGNVITDQDIEAISLKNNCYNCSILNNQLFDNSLNAPSIYLTNSNYCLISNNTILSDGQFGIILWSSDNVNITLNKIELSSPDYTIGIYFYQAGNCSLASNNFTNCGIFLAGKDPQYYRYHKIDSTNKVNNKTLYYYVDQRSLFIQKVDNPGQIFLVNCNDSFISDIDVSNSTIGIDLIDCYNITLHNITSDSNFAGVVLDKTNKSVIANHSILYNFFGILILESNNNVIANSSIKFNSNSGIDVDINSTNNNIYGNCFESNAQNGKCDNSQNSWNSTFIGNYWDDYSGVDSNDDNIGDTVHVDINIQDYLPIWWDVPVISIISPSNFSIYGRMDDQNFTIMIDEGFGNYTWHEFLETGNSSVFTELNGTIDEEFNGTLIEDQWDLLDNGTTTIRFYANDSRGYIGFSDLYIHIDILAPIINILSPVKKVSGITPPNFSLSIIDGSLNEIWYTINQNNTKYFCTANGKINQTAWNILPDGPLNITFHANDTFGHEHSETVLNYKDTQKPMIIDNQGDIVQYSPGELYDVDFRDSDPMFNISFVQYIIYNNTGQSGTQYSQWINISTNIRANEFTDDWSIDFTKCRLGKNYISVRVYDEAGNCEYLIDAFIVTKTEIPYTNPLRDLLLLIMIGVPILLTASFAIYYGTKYYIKNKIDPTKLEELKKKAMLKKKENSLSLADKYLEAKEKAAEAQASSIESEIQSLNQPEDQVQQIPSFETTTISIICPICKKNKNVVIPKSIINEAKLLTAVSIAKDIVCEHHFQAFVDKNYIVRGYQKIDFHL